MYCSESISRKITVLSFFAMITVVSIHSDPLPLMAAPSCFCRNLSRISSMLKDWAVPYFYVVSGFFFARCYAHRTYGEFMSGKVRSLIIPYLLWGGVYGTITMLPLEIAVNKFHGAPLLFNTRIGGGVLHTLDRFFGIFYSSPYDGALWYVRMLVLFFALAPIWIFILRRCDWLLFVLGVLGIFLFKIGGGQHDVLFSFGTWSFDITFSSIAWLLLGMFVASRHLEDRHSNCAIFFGIVLLLINIIFGGGARESARPKGLVTCASLLCLEHLRCIPQCVAGKVAVSFFVIVFLLLHTSSIDRLLWRCV